MESGGRIHFVDGGDLGDMLDTALGMVCVNSTSATLALARGLSVCTIGEAVYDIPDLTHQGHLDSFWTSPTTPEPGVHQAFRRVLADRCLVRGGPSSESAVETLIGSILERLRIVDSHGTARPPTADVGVQPVPAAERDRVPYLQWADEGWLERTPGRATDRVAIARRLADVRQAYDVKGIAFDRWRFEDLGKLLSDEGIDLPLVEFIPGFRSYAPAVDAFERAVLDRRMQHNGNPLMRWQAGNIIIETARLETGSRRNRKA